MWQIDVGIPIRDSLEEAIHLRENISKQFGVPIFSYNVFGYIEFRIRKESKVDALKAKLGIKSFLEQNNFVVIDDGEVSIRDAYVLMQPEEGIEIVTIPASWKQSRDKPPTASRLDTMTRLTKEK